MVIENALVLAAARRLIRPAGCLPLGAIRWLAYFLPVIEEVLSLRVSPDYFRYLRHSIERLAQTRQARAASDRLRAFGADDEKATRAPSAWMLSLSPISFTPRLRRG